jgi:hypothetical protein
LTHCYVCAKTASALRSNRHIKKVVVIPEAQLLIIIQTIDAAVLLVWRIGIYTRDVKKSPEQYYN